MSPKFVSRTKGAGDFTLGGFLEGAADGGFCLRADGFVGEREVINDFLAFDDCSVLVERHFDIVAGPDLKLGPDELRDHDLVFRTDSNERH